MKERDGIRISKRKFVIVDGSSLLPACYYAVLPREIVFARTDEGKEKHCGKILHASDGIYTDGIMGMLEVVVSLPRKQQPAYVAFVFDKARDTFRRELYPDYKGTRSKIPEPLKQQFVLVEQTPEEVGFKVLYSDRYEADDHAGNPVYKFREQVPMVVITEDHNYLQFANDKYNTKAWVVQVRRKKAEEPCDKYYGLYDLSKALVNLLEKTSESTAEAVYFEEGVWPRQTTNLRGIQSDTPDNIPGVHGVASAAPLLLGEYGTVEHIYKVTYEAEQDKKQLKELQDFWKDYLGISCFPCKSLIKTREEGELCGETATRLSKKLATIKTDIPLDFELEDPSIPCCREEVLKEWCGRLDIRTISVFRKG